MLRLSREHVECSREEKGGISHAVHIDCENPHRLFFFEQSVDEDALRAHFAVPASRAFVKALRDQIVEATGTQMYRTESIPR